MHLIKTAIPQAIRSAFNRKPRPGRLAMAYRAAVAGLALAVVIVSPGGVMGQASHTSHFDGLDVTISLNRTAIAVGDTIALNIRLENTSNSPKIKVTANYQLPPGNNLNVQVQPAGELEYRYAGPLASGTYSSIPIEVAAGTPESVDVLLYFDPTQPSGLLFPKPGSYSLAAGFKFMLRGNPSLEEAFLPATTIEVSAPAGETEDVLKSLANPEFIRALHVGMIPTTDTLTALTPIAEKHSRTEPGALALKAVGNTYAKSAAREDREKGAQLLTRFLREGVVKSGNDSIVWNIAAAYHLNEQYDLAREWIFYLVRAMPTSSRIQPEDPLVYFYYLAPRNFSENVPWYLLKESWILPGVKPPADLKPRMTDQQ